MACNTAMDSEKWYTCSMAYSSALRNNSGFSGKWVDLQKIILSETTQTQKDKHSMFSLILAPSPQKKRRKHGVTTETKRTKES